MHTETITWYANRDEYPGQIPERVLVKIRHDAFEYVVEASHHTGPGHGPRGVFVAQSSGRRGFRIEDAEIVCFAPLPTGDKTHCQD